MLTEEQVRHLYDCTVEAYAGELHKKEHDKALEQQMLCTLKTLAMVLSRHDDAIERDIRAAFDRVSK